MRAGARDDAMIRPRLKRWLYLTHRWIGIATCLLFAMWFLSGLVMLHVPFPSLGAGERLAGLPAIDWRQARIGPAEAARAAGLDAPPREAVLEMRGDRPVWRLSPWDGEVATILAAEGRPAGPVGGAEARRIAALFGRAPVTDIRAIHNDQWSVAGGYNRDRPLWKAALAGPEGRILYVSSRTGAVVLDTHATERFWNWLGSVPHWLYPRALRQDQPVWRQVVLWLSGPCILGALTGMWIGLLNLRPGRRRFRDGRMTPYRGWMRWHHVAGLAGGLFLIAWIFSGWLSVDPGRLFARGGLAPGNRIAYAGPGAIPAPDMARLAALAPDARRVVLLRAAGRDMLRIERPDAPDRLLDAATLAPPAPDENGIIRAAAAALVPGARLVAADRLTTSDAYWYAVDGDVPLPVLRLRFDDAAATWVHVDPRSGAILGATDARGRLYRWLFGLLHRWDLGPLLAHPPARELLVWLASLAGLVTSVSAIRIGWARLRRPAGPHGPA